MGVIFSLPYQSAQPNPVKIRFTIEVVFNFNLPYKSCNNTAYAEDPS